MFTDFKAKLIKKENLVKNVWEITYEHIGEGNQFIAGQYHILVIGDNYRQYSISSSVANTKQFQFLIAYFDGGVASDYLSNLEIGEISSFRGPAGMFTYSETTKDVVFLATGTGIGPIKSMIMKALKEDQTHNFKLFFGLKSVENLFLLSWLQETAQKHPNFSYTICLSQSDERSCNQVGDNNICSGRINLALESYWESHDLKSLDYYICGSKDVVVSLRDYIFNKGASPENIHFENFG